MAPAPPPPPFWQYLGDWLRERGWTQMKFSDELGVHQTVTGRWLHANPRRRAKPGRRILPRLAEVLGTTVQELVDMIDADTLSDQILKADTELKRTRDVEEAYAHFDAKADPKLVTVATLWPQLNRSARDALATLAKAAAGELIDAYLPAYAGAS